MSLFNFLFKTKKDFEKTLEKTLEREKKGEELFRHALHYSQMGDQENAIKYFTKSIEVSEKHSSAFLNRGSCLMIQERYLESFDDFSKAIELENNGDSLDPVPSSELALENIRRISPMLAFEKQQGDKVRNLFKNDGIEHFSRRFSDVIIENLDGNVEKVMQFILEELKEIEEMGGEHQTWVLNHEIEYTRIKKMKMQYDTNNAFILFKGILCCFSRDFKLMFSIRKKIIENMYSAIK